MANITQTIPALTAGISQQPDEQKIPGQVKDMVNALPDVTQGLTKRPAGKFVASLSDGTNNSFTTGKWFHYYRDENEQYIGQVIRRTGHADDGKIRMWDCQTGAEKTVVNGIGNFTYLQHTNDEDIQTLTLNDFTYINNRSITTEMDTTTEPLGDFGKEVFVELKKVAYASQYSLNVFDTTATQQVTTATRISVTLENSSNNYCDTNGFMRTHADRGNSGNGRCDASAGDGRDAFAPNVGTRIFSVSTGTTLVDEGATGGLQATTGNPGTDINYSYPVNIFNAANQGSQSGRSNLFFRIATTGQSVPFTSGSGSDQTTVYQARYTTTHDLLHGGEGWQEGDYFRVFMMDAQYKITIESVSISNAQANLALVRPQPTPFDTETTVTAESILGDIRKGVTGSDTSDTGNGFTVKIIGTGLHIKRAANFNASTPVGELLNVVASKVNDVGDLPSQCKHGMVVEVVNSVADEDNHYVKFFGKLKSGGDPDNDNDYLDGEGTWEECAQPGRKIRLKRSKMPVLLIRTADGNFRLSELDGSSYSLLEKSGVYQQSGTTVSITLANHGFSTGDLVGFNFLTGAAASASHKNAVVTVTVSNTATFTFQVTSGLTASNGNVEFGLASYSVPQWDDALVGDDVTNPEPSFIGKNISKMLFFRNRFAILADENIVLSRPGDFTNFFAKSAIQLIPSDPIDIAASSEYPAILFDGIQINTGLLLFSKNQQFMLTTDSDVFAPTTAKINALSTYNFNFATNPISLGTTIGFLDNAGKFSRFFEMTQVQREGEPEVIEQSAVVARLFEKDLKLISNSRENSVIFFSEEGTSTLYGYRYFDNIRERKLASWFRWTLTGTIQYHCMQDDNLYVVVRNNNKDQLLKYAIKMDSNTFALAENRVHLDHLMSVTTASNTYNATTNKTTFPKPTGIESTNQLAAYDVDSGAQLGRYGLITINGSNLEIDGNWSSQTFLIGHQFTMQVDLPTLYYVTKEGENFRADTRSSLVLHRAKLGFGPVGLYETTLNRTGRVSYTELFELTGADQYAANASSVVDDNIVREVPIFDANTNVLLTIKSTHPAPATIHNLTWEGAYNTKFYQRV